MESRQRRTVFYGALLAAAMFAFPPTGNPISYGRLSDPSYSFIGMIPPGDAIDNTRLIVQLAILAVVCYFVGFYEKRS